MEEPTEREGLSVAEAAERAGTRQPYIYRLAYRENSPFETWTVRTGPTQHQLRISKESFEEWMRTRRRRSSRSERIGRGNPRAART
jgi:excisionase family DNA binding protein